MGIKTRAPARPPTQVPEEFAEKARRRPMSRPLDEEWQPSAEDRAWAATARADLDAAVIERQTAKFRLHARHSARCSHNWHDAWRAWILDAHGQKGAAGQRESWNEKRLREGREALKP